MWSPEEKKLLLHLKKQCLVHMFVQSTSSYVNQIIQNCLSIPSIIIGGVLSVSIFSMTSDTWRIASGILAITGTIISSFQKYISAAEKSQMHISTVRQYQVLIRDINIHLSIPMDDVNKVSFVQDVKLEMDNIFTNQPDPSLIAIKYFQSRFKTRFENALFEDYDSINIPIYQNSPMVRNERDRCSIYPKMNQRYSTRALPGFILDKDNYKDIYTVNTMQDSPPSYTPSPAKDTKMSNYMSHESIEKNLEIIRENEREHEQEHEYGQDREYDHVNKKNSMKKYYKNNSQDFNEGVDSRNTQNNLKSSQELTFRID